MAVRIPLEDDFEDRLLYGLDPRHLAYAATSGLMAVGALTHPGGPSLFRAAAALLVALAGSAFSWGRWGGRALDAWLLDVLLYASRNYAFEFSRGASVRPLLLELATAVAKGSSAWRRRLRSPMRPRRQAGA